MYKIAFEFLKKYFSEATLFKHGFNISPMYRRSVARIIYVSENLQEVVIKIPLNYKNRNYVGSIYGGSMLSATDPIYMTQLMNILGNDFVVWDKATTVRYKRPAREQVFAKFIFSDEEIIQIKNEIILKNEIDLIKKVNIVNKSDEVFAEVTKTIYISQKSYYKQKVNKRKLTE
jgi:hypothetical protein